MTWWQIVLLVIASGLAGAAILYVAFCIWLLNSFH
jgi:hypothetical protein